MNDTGWVSLAHLIRWADNHEGAGTWLAGIATLLAVTTALDVPAWQERLRRHEARSRADIFLHEISDEFKSFMLELEAARARLEGRTGSPAPFSEQFQSLGEGDRMKMFSMSLPKTLASLKLLPKDLDRHTIADLLRLRRVYVDYIAQGSNMHWIDQSIVDISPLLVALSSLERASQRVKQRIDVVEKIR